MRRALIAPLSFAAAMALAEETPLYLRIDTPPAPVLDVQAALETFRLAPGYHIEAVAHEPLVEDPVALTWDAAGRMYVAEMRGFMQDTYGTDEDAPIGSVVRLSDTDGDGRMDRREVLADGLVLPRAVAIVNEGLLIGEPPNLWLCPARNGRADSIDCTDRQRLGSYGDQPGSVEHAENGLLLGLDNWLYSAKSARRLKLVDGGLTEEPTLFRGQWGIAQDGEGRLYYNTNSNLLSGDRYDAQNIVQSGASRAPGLNVRVSGDDALYAVRVNTGVNRAYLPGVLREDGRLNQPTSASGMDVLDDTAFVAEPAANAVAHLQLSEQGMTVTARHARYPDDTWGQREFLASTDERFRPVNVYFGPDGALYVVDMYRGVIQDHVFITEQLREQAKARGLDRPPGLGRIWRVSRDYGSYAPAQLEGADSGVLLASLASANVWERRTAQRLLLAADNVDRELRAMVRAAQLPQAVHALWALAGRATLDRRIALGAARSAQLPLARQALIAGAPLFNRRDISALVALHPDDERFQMEAIAALAPHNTHATVRSLALDVLARHWQHDARRAAVIASMRGQEQAFIAALAAGWTAEQEASSLVVRALAAQHVRNSDDGAVLAGLLDLAAAQPAWVQRAILDGAADVTRREGFERIVLAEAHPLFSAPTADESLWPAVSRARKAFTWPGDTLAADAAPLSPAQQARMADGARYYAGRCATCHGGDGEGIAALAPPLVNSPWVIEAPERLARIVLHGLQGPIEVDGQTWNGVMPGHGLMADFDDAVASGLLTYLNRSWGHSGRAIDPPFMAAIRQATAGRAMPWTVEALHSVPVNTHFEDYNGRYGGGSFGLQFSYDGASRLLIHTGLFSGPLEVGAADRFYFEPRDMHFDFVRDDAGAVRAVNIRTGDDAGNTLPRIPDADG